jgi:hypothetical protein
MPDFPRSEKAVRLVDQTNLSGELAIGGSQASGLAVYEVIRTCQQRGHDPDCSVFFPEELWTAVSCFGFCVPGPITFLSAAEKPY